jgi:heme-degrading monooxygenase HmoA
MFARVSRIQASPDAVELSIRSVEQTTPALRQLRGFKHAYALADRDTGRILTITFWDTIEDLRASEERAAQIRAQIAQAGGVGGEALVDRYEVVVEV